jgi:hypothetical protein
MSKTIPPLTKPALSTAKAAQAFAEADPSKEVQRKIAWPAPEGFKRLTINLPIELHKRMKLAAVEEDTTATAIIERLLEEYLAQREARQHKKKS